MVACLFSNCKNLNQMKMNQNLILTAIVLAALHLSATSYANTATTVANDGPAPRLETFDNPGKKKKCRRCVRWHPVRMFKSGQVDALLGVGVVPTFLMDKAKVVLPPVSLGADYRFNEKFSLGVLVGHSISKSEPTIVGDGIAATWTNSFYHIALRPAVHVTSIEDWDFYGGFSIGMQMSNVKGSANSPDMDLSALESHMGIGGQRTNGTFSGFLGLRYVVSPKWTIGAEAGFSVSILTIGVTRLLN